MQKFVLTDNEDSNETAQADLRLSWAHMPEGMFYVTAHISVIQ